MGIEVGKGDEKLYVELLIDGGVQYISISDSPEEDPCEIGVGLHQVDDLVQALQSLRARAGGE